MLAGTMRSLLLLSLALAAFTVRAQVLPGGAELGMSVPQLQQAVPALERVPWPVRMAGGLVGSWRAATLQVAGVALMPTFFFSEGELRRVEYVADATAYDALLAWGRATWGAELASQGSEGAYAAWTTGTTQAYLQQAAGARPQVRLVVKRITAKDAGEL